MGLDRTQTGTRYVVGTRPDASRAGSRAAAIVFGAAGILYVGFVLACVVSRAGVPMTPGWTAKAVRGVYTVTAANQAVRNAGLQPGDRLRSVAGEPAAGVFGPALALSRLPYGASYSVEAERGGAVRTIFLSMNPSARPDWGEFSPNLFVAILLFATSVYIAALRWRNLTARLAAISFMITGLAITSVVLIEFPGWGRLSSALAIVLLSLHRPWELPLAYDFCSRFPRSVEEAPAARWLRRALYFWAALLWIPFTLPVLAHVLGAPPLSVFAALVSFRPDGEFGAPIVAGFESITAALSCIVLVRNYARLRSPDSRRRILWAGLAIASSVGTFLLFAFLKLAWNLTGSESVRHWEAFVNDAGTFIVGLSVVGFGYAVSKHRVLGIRFALRQGLQYLLAKNVLRLMVLLPLFVVLAQAIANPERGLREIFLRGSWPLYLAVAIAGTVGLRYQVQIRPWLDRRFFRVELVQEQILAALMERIKQVESEKELCLVAGRELDAALDVDGCHLFLSGQNGHVRVAYSRLPDRAARLRDWLNSDGMDYLGSGSFFMLYEVQENSWDGDTYESEPAEHLVVPVRGADRNATITLALGPKRSEQPYTSRDRDLLLAIAAQMAIVREVLQLKKSVEQERRTRVQVLGRLDRQDVHLLTECPDCGRCCTTMESTCPDHGVSLSLTLPVERTIEGKYLLERRIGRGGMGVVYRALDLRLDRRVAIKIMMGDLFGNNVAMSRFAREARAVAALHHPNIVAVYDFGWLPAGGAYLAMELIDGQSWRHYIKPGRGMAFELACPALRQLCLAVEASHAGGVIHRDLKPENIVIAGDVNQWRVVVLDFGLARFRAELLSADRSLTVTGAIVGTLGYMSPEQRYGRKVDPSTDVYSVGVICAETLTGRRPPKSGASLDWLRSALRGSLSLPGPLVGVLERALAQQRAQRPSMREFLDALVDAESTAGPETPGSSFDPENIETLTLPPPGMQGDNSWTNRARKHGASG
jgi:tRNA A-37 threonylcarbamoyl transferase component Bud32